MKSAKSFQSSDLLENSYGVRNSSLDAVSTDGGMRHNYTQIARAHHREGCAQLGGEGFAPGLAYVGVLRVKSLNGLMLEESFDLSRFQGKENITKRIRLVNTEHH